MADWRVLLTEAYGRFHDVSEQSRDKFPGLTSFDVVELAETVKGALAWAWGIPSEIREIINIVNAWGIRLHDWGIWNRVLEGYGSDDEKWTITDHFVEPIAFFCMFQPSGLVDRLMVTSETALHQANLRAFQNERDRLDQDEQKPGTVFRRGDRKRQLNRLGSRWSTYAAFRQALDAVDDAGYRKASHNFRDLSAHSYAPRLMVGHVSRAFRSKVPWQQMVRQADWTFAMTDHPTKKAISYALTELPPVSLTEMRDLSLGEYQKAKLALDKFSDLISEICTRTGLQTPGQRE